MDNQTAITLKPKLGYWVSKYFVIIVVASLLPFSAIYWDLEMPVHYALMVLFLVVWIMLCYTYIDTLFATKWIITKDELIFRHGIISRREEHLELYRVIDYSEAVLISFDKSVKHDLDECNLYHSFCGFSKEFVIDGQPSEVFQP